MVKFGLIWIQMQEMRRGLALHFHILWLMYPDAVESFSSSKGTLPLAMRGIPSFGPVSMAP